MTRETDGLVLTDEFRHALELLAGGRHLFLTGKAGTGKSTLIRRFMVETDRAVVVVAPTGIAALNVDGYTIHRLFSFSTTTSLDDVRTGHHVVAMVRTPTSGEMVVGALPSGVTVKPVSQSGTSSAVGIR